MFKKLFDLFKRSTPENEDHNEPCEEYILPKAGEVWVMGENRQYVVIDQYLEGWVFYKLKHCPTVCLAKKIDDFVYIYNKIPNEVAKLMIEKGII